jgi:TRAP-type C4-dicarboxylate transport system substrate-binding protein
VGSETFNSRKGEEVLKMRHLELSLPCTLLFLALIGFSFLTTLAYGQAKPVELTYSTFVPAVHEQGKLTTEWAKEIETRTNGRVKITVFYGGTLSPADKSYDGVVKGISDIACSAPSYTKGRFPLTEAVEQNIGSKSIFMASVVTKMANEFYNRFKPKEFDDVKVMFFFCPGGQFLHTKKPVNNLEDLKGIKIRSNGVSASTLKALGGVPVVTPMGESYETVSRGVAEGVWCPLEALQSWKLGELVKYSTECFGASNTSSMFVVMNKDKWNALAPDLQKIIEKVNEEWIEKTGRGWEKLDSIARDFLLGSGHKFISLSEEEQEKWRKGVRPLLDDYVNNMKAKSLPGEEALRFCMDYLKKH